MTLVLLDTNAYLRLGKRISPLLGIKFGQKSYELTILKEVEREVQRSSRLRHNYPWFEKEPFKGERKHKRVRLKASEKKEIDSMTSVLRAHVLDNTDKFTKGYRSPPSTVDCFCLAFGQIRSSVVVTDDIGMHILAEDFELPVWYGHELLKKMYSAKMIHRETVEDIYQALENNMDMDQGWSDAKHTVFKKIFGPNARC